MKIAHVLHYPASTKSIDHVPTAVNEAAHTNMMFREPPLCRNADDKANEAEQNLRHAEVRLVSIHQVNERPQDSERSVTTKLGPDTTIQVPQLNLHLQREMLSCLIGSNSGHDPGRLVSLPNWAHWHLHWRALHQARSGTSTASARMS